MAIPVKDADLVAWGSNFDQKATASPVTYSLTAAQALSFHTLFETFETAYDALTVAREAGIRSVPLTSAKRQARKDFLVVARQLYGFIQDANTSTVPNNVKEEIGVTPRQQPNPIPAPSSAPGIEIETLNGWSVKIRLFDTQTSGRRGKLPGTAGASIFSFVGANPPTDLSEYQFEGNTGKVVVDLTFPNSLPAGTKVWITAFWFNNRKQSGPMSAPISANLPGGSVSMAA
jgi:hypothetical protein